MVFITLNISNQILSSVELSINLLNLSQQAIDNLELYDLFF